MEYIIEVGGSIYAPLLNFENHNILIVGDFIPSVIRMCEYSLYGSTCNIFPVMFLQTFKTNEEKIIEVGLSPKKHCVICFNESPSKMMRNAFYFIIKALFGLKIFKFLSWRFGHVGKTAWLER